MPTISLVPSKIRTSRVPNARLHEPDDKRETLAASVREHGDHSAPWVVKHTDGVYDLVAGFGRHAQRMAASPDVAADYEDVTGTKSVAALQLAENNARTSLHWVDTAAALLRVRDADYKGVKLTQAQLGAKVGLSQAMVSDYLTIVDHPDWTRILEARKAGTLLQPFRIMSTVFRNLTAENGKKRKLTEEEWEHLRTKGELPTGKPEEAEGVADAEAEGEGEGKGAKEKGRIESRGAAHANALLKAYQRIPAKERSAGDKEAIKVLRYLLKLTETPPIEYEVTAQRGKRSAEASA